VLLGAAQALRGRTGTPLLPQEMTGVERATGVAAGALGARAFAELLEQGQAMSVQEAAHYPAAGDNP
jgi:hypothetical protein